MQRYAHPRPERFDIRQRAFEKANNGLHDNIHLPLLSLAPLLVGLITRKILLPSNIQAKRLELISTDASPPHYNRPTKMGPSHYRKNGIPP
jgi:hypothetical protein